MARAHRFDSLLMRLLVMQGVLALVLVMLLTVVFYVERNVTVSRLVAERWAPVLRDALGPTLPGSAAFAPLMIDRRAEAPHSAWRIPSFEPRLRSFAEAMKAQGINVERAALAFTDDGPQIWVRLAGGADKPWFGITSKDLWPNLPIPIRMLVSFSFGFVLIVGSSILFTRRLTQPLRQLDLAIRAQSPDVNAAALPSPAVAMNAPPELRAIDAAWRDLLERYRRHESERAVLLAGVSHDLRSPLARIRMAADLLPDSVSQRRDSIARNVHVADQLIESFLDYVRAGELPFDERCDLADLVSRVTNRFERSSELQVQVPTELWCEKANTLLLERLVFNLVDNAFKHGAAPVGVVLKVEGGAPVIEVSDAGAGIPPQQWKHATQAFTRGDPSRATPGSGLGLAIVARIAQQLSGQLQFAHENDRFVVRVSLPMMTLLIRPGEV